MNMTHKSIYSALQKYRLQMSAVTLLNANQMPLMIILSASRSWKDFTAEFRMTDIEV